MQSDQILVVFVGLKIFEALASSWLAHLNRRYYLDETNRTKVLKLIGMGREELERATAYTEDKYHFGEISGWVQLAAFLLFLWFGGFGYTESISRTLAAAFGFGEVAAGLIFFGVLGGLSSFLSLPFDWYGTFVVEEKHGFNRQTVSVFVVDRIKGLFIAVLFGGGLLLAILSLMEMLDQHWWIWAWLVMSAFSIFMVWIFPTVLAPLFNKFTALADGELKDRIHNLAERVGFRAGEVFVMDASRRSSHGNAYFTGIFGRKRIVLFDTLLQSLEPRQIEAVLAHELGHFKLHHVRWRLVQSVLMLGTMFYLLSLALPHDAFYHSFRLSGVSNFGALLVFSSWFSLSDFLLGPISAWWSRRNEFAADCFAGKFAKAEDLIAALKKLRESNASMPLAHPWYSRVYYSHPPLAERIEALKVL